MSSEVIEGEIVLYGAPIGRPLSYTKDIGDEICQRLSLTESLRRICRDDHMPDRVTVYRWLWSSDPVTEEFRNNYARARDIQADDFIDEVNDIADDGSNDWMEVRDKVDGSLLGWKVNGEAIQRSRLRIDTRKWVAGKQRPKKYGDRTIIGGDPDNPLLPSGNNDLELARIIVFQLAKAEKIADSSAGDGETIDG